MNLKELWQAKSTQQFHQPTSWRQLAQGERYFTALQTYFSPWTTKILGYQILKVGGLSGEIYLDLPLRHQITLLPEYPTHPQHIADHTTIQSNLTNLPFVEKSIDACFLANTLNFCADPHQLLREIQRVMANDGYLFLSLFELASPLLWKRQLGQSTAFPFRQYATWRVLDWLNLLHFHIVDYQRLPLAPYPKWFSPLTAIVARKQTYPISLTPAKVRFKTTEFLQPANAFKESQI